MRAERLQSMAEQAIALDTETHLVQPGLLAPPMVCGSAARLDDGQIVGHLLSPERTRELFTDVLREPARILVGANIAFDILVLLNELSGRRVDLLPAVFTAFDEERVYDLQLAEALNAIAGGHLFNDPRTGKPLTNPDTGKRGRYSLAACVDLVLGRKDAKRNDEWRLRYAELEAIPMVEWPETARVYPVDDAKNTLECALAQAGHLPKTTPLHRWGDDGCLDCGTTGLGELCVTKRPHRNLHDLSAQVKAAFALHLGAAWGFAVDQGKVDVIETYARRHRSAGIAPFQAAGLVRDNGSLDEGTLKRLVARAYGCTDQCPVCRGAGKIPSRNPRLLRCSDCKGRSAPWRWGGKLHAPTRLCTTCNNTGKVVDQRHTVTCSGPDGEKTCDGTGLSLVSSVPRSDTGCVSTSADTLHESGDDFLMRYGDFTEDAKWLKDYIPFLRSARRNKNGVWMNIPLTLRPNPIVKSGRVSYTDHTQTFPRWAGFVDKESGVYIPSFRECIIARPGYVFSSEDFRAGELVTGAQSSRWLVGFSDLGDTLLSKDADGKPMDCHSQLAAQVIGVPYEEFARNRKQKKYSDMRGASKPFLFGKPGGMGAVRIVIAQRKGGPDTPHPAGPSLVEDENGNLVPGYTGLRFCLLMGGQGPCGREKLLEWRDRPIPPTCAECIDCAVRLDQHWRSTFREYPRYFDYVTDCVELGQIISREALARWPHLQRIFRPDERLEPGQIMQHVSGRVRGGLTFPEAANGFFQGLLADISKEAYWRVTKECYVRHLRVPAFLYENSLRSEFACAESPLLGSRSVGFFHDELLNEHPASVASDAAKRVSEIMRDVMRWYCPDYADAAEAEPTLMAAWDKRASMIVHRGTVQVWTPDHDPKRCAECRANN
jgi:hypothetical protein